MKERITAGRIIPYFLLIASLAMPSVVYSQASQTKIRVFNQEGQPIQTVVDGNTIQLEYESDQPVQAEIRVDFLLEDDTNSVANCRIPMGKRTCRSGPLTTLGWYWDQTGNQHSKRTIFARTDLSSSSDLSQVGSQGSLEIEISPRPVVMVHGFNSTWEAWSAYLGPDGFLGSIGIPGYAVGDGQVAGVMDTGSLGKPAARTNSIAQNAMILAEYIANVQARTGAEKVDLLVHSMGGMIARYYLDRIMTTNNVSQLIILGTPMAGSACASLPAALGLLLPATLEIQPRYMTGVFNQQITHRQGVPFYALAGTKMLDSVQSPCTPVPSDLVVTVDSVKAIPMPVMELPLLHTELNTSSVVFESFVKPLLKTAPGKFESGSDPDIVPTTTSDVQFTRTYTGHLNPGETSMVTISIDPNVSVANFALYDTSRSLDVQVTGASGKVIHLDPVKNGFIRVDDPTSLLYLGYGFKDPKPGKWIVTLLTSATTPPSGADYAISANFVGGATLTAQTSLTVPSLNEPVMVSADLNLDGAPIPITSATAQIRKPDGNLEVFDLEIIRNSARFEVKPKMSGIYGIEVNISAISADGYSIDRSASLSFETQPAEKQIKNNRILVVAGILLLLIAVYLFWILRKKHGRPG